MQNRRLEMQKYLTACKQAAVSAVPTVSQLVEGIRGHGKISQFNAYRIVLRAAVREGDFHKNIPLETKQFIDKDPERAQEFFKDKGQAHPEIMQYLRTLTQKGQPPKQSIRENLVAMQSELNQTVLSNPQYLTSLAEGLSGDATKDWSIAQGVASPKLIKYLQHNTMLSAQEFIRGLITHGANLDKIITPDILL